MFEKNMKVSYLVDVYDSLLDEHTKEIMRAYYEDDLSLSEIASGENISRQGVRHIIKKCEEELLQFESGLGLAEHYAKLDKTAQRLFSIAKQLMLRGDDELCEIAKEIAAAADELSGKQAD